MRFVELKSQEQLDVQSLHRVRSRLVGVRTALINQMRAVLLERGIIVAQGRRKFEKALDEMFADDALFSPGRLRDLLLDMRAEWSALDRRIGALDQEFVQLARTDEVARRLTSIPGVGALTRRRWSPRLARPRRSPRRGILVRGSDSFHGSTQRAASRGCSGSASEGTPISGRY
jgi:transposase